MNCIKCGKELTDGRRKICPECSEKEKKEKEELKAKKAAEKKAKEESKKTEEKKEESKKSEGKKSFKLSKEIIVCIAFVVIAIVLIVCMMLSGKKVGNTIGNIRNYGYATIDGNYIYYLAPNEDSTSVGIFKVKKDGTGTPENLFMDDLDVVSINVYNGYVYFIGVGPDAYNEQDDFDNKIYRMKTNGSGLTVINDNEFSDDCYEIYVINGSIYYIGTDNNIYKMALDGSNRKLVSDNSTGYLGITEKYIVYNVETENEAGYTTYIMNIDGTNQRALIENERLYSVNISGDYVYYTNIDKQICRTKIDSGKSELVLDTTAYNMNLNGDYIYYLNYKDINNGDNTVCLYKIKADMSEETATNIKELDSYSSFINIVGDWVIYMDSNETEGFINLVKTDGSNEVCLYLLDYTEYYSADDSANTPTDDTANTPDTTPDNTPTEATNTPAEGDTQPNTTNVVPENNTVQQAQ